MRFRIMPVLLILCALAFSACGANATAEELFLEDMDSITAEIQAMYEEIRPELLSAPEYDPDIFIAFADLDFDGIPEYFYGYQTMTGSHNKIWYRAYSLSDRAMIDFEHLNSFDTYIRDDTDCAFFTGPDSFIEGYYLNDMGEPCFVTKATAGPVTGTWTDYIFMEYKNSILTIETGFECDKKLLPIKQVWSQAALENIQDDMYKLLNEYLD